MNLNDALSQLALYPNDTLLFAGGTDLMVQNPNAVFTKNHVINLAAIPELCGVCSVNGQVEIGAATTFTQILQSKELSDFCMLLIAARQIGSVAIQNMGTLGGNIANASPAAESSIALLAYNAKLELACAGSLRTLDYSDFHLGYKRTALLPHEMITKIILPKRPRGFVDYYEKVGTRAALSIAKVGIAATHRIVDGKMHDVRIAFSSVGPKPLRCFETEGTFEGKTLMPDVIQKATEALANEISPVDDIRSNAIYRRRVASNLLEQFVTRVKC